MDKYQQLSEMIAQSERIVFFGGAGVSTESGLPDYRSKDGKYTAMRQSNDDPKKIMHIDYLSKVGTDRENGRHYYAKCG